MIYLEDEIEDGIEKYENAKILYNYKNEVVKCEEKSVECIFCLENIDSYGLCHLKCKHVFHGYCFLKYIKYCKKDIHCPLCRDKVTKERIEDIYDYYYRNILEEIDKLNSEIIKRKNKIFIINFKKFFGMNVFNINEEFMMMELDILKQEKMFFRKELYNINFYFFTYLHQNGII